jgi:hypothetical protein
MQAPDASHANLKNPFTLCQGTPVRPVSAHKCANCGIEFPHRKRGGNRFHDSKCRGQFTQNRRSAIRHIRTSLVVRRRPKLFECDARPLAALLAVFVDSLPSTETGRQEKIWQELRRLDEWMCRTGPVDRITRESIRTRAYVVALALRHEAHRNLVDRKLFIHARELLRDVGVEGPLTTATINELLTHAEAAIRFFLETRDHLNLGRALMACGNIYRLAGQENKASPRFTWAFDVLNEGRFRVDADSKILAWYRHQAAAWRIRTRGCLMGEGERLGQISELNRLAQTVNDPRIWVEHYREEAGYASYLLNDRDLAHQRLTDLAVVRRSLTNYTPYGDPTLLTPRIQLLFESDHREEAIEVIKRDYFGAYVKHRHAYYCGQLSRWMAQHKFNLQASLPPADYCSAFLSWLPCYTDVSLEGYLQKQSV